MNFKSILNFIYEVIKTIALVFLIAFIIRYFLIQPFVIDGYSMEPNLHNNEYILVDMVSYHLKNPQQGEIIIFKFPQKPSVSYIKRIIGAPGDCISINNNKIYLNNRVVNEPYLGQNTNTVSNREMTNDKKCLGKNDYFVMGDNREHSSDSREWGVVPRSNIVGRAWLKVYPLSSFGFIKHYDLSSANQFGLKLVLKTN